MFPPAKKGCRCSRPFRLGPESAPTIAPERDVAHCLRFSPWMRVSSSYHLIVVTKRLVQQCA